MGGLKLSDRALLAEPSPSDWDAWEQAILERIRSGDLEFDPGDVARELGFNGSSTFKRSDLGRHGEVMAAWKAERDQATRTYVGVTLRENIERAMAAVPVVDAKGNETGVYEYEGQVANRALELLGKTAGLFVAPSQSDASGDGPDDPLGIMEMTIEQRLIIRRRIITEHPELAALAGDVIDGAAVEVE